MGINFKKFLPHLIVIIGFIIASLAYFNPIISGKKLFQSDIHQSKGMTRQRTDFRKKHHEETYWIDNAFGGMPLYLPSTKYPHDFIKTLDSTLRFLSHPADYLFLYFVGLYILFLIFKVDYRLAALGALAFGFSTYLIIIIGVGHNSKAHAIAYMPMVLAGIFAVFKNKYFWGGLLLALSLALEIFTGHVQITYYLLFVVIIIGIVYLYQAFRKKQLPKFFKSIGVMAIAAVLAISANATQLLTLEQYTQFSTRGDTGLTITKTGEDKPEKGLSYDYITEYSYGLAETMNLFIPRFTGGASTESLDTDSHTYKALTRLGLPANQAKQFIENAPTYWGKQPIVAAPNYIGATVIFLFILALYLVKGRLKWWVVGASLLALVLSWGDNFSILTKFFIAYVPLYAKFRTVSMIQVILQMLIPFFGIYGLTQLFSDHRSKSKKLNALKQTTLITAGICVFFLLFKTWLFDFSGPTDQRYLQNAGADFVDALKKDRISMLNADTIRSLVFIVLLASTILAYLKEKLNKPLVIGIFTVLILVDLVSVDRNYVNDDDFVSKRQLASPFQPNAADKEIMKDKSHYRVLDLSVNPMNTGRTSYFHNAIGGYHGAKPGRIQELYDFYIANGLQKAIKGENEVVNMLNVKYFILKNDDQTIARPNPNADGTAWFVNEVDFVDSVNDEMRALDNINPSKTAVINSKFKNLITQTQFSSHPDDTIALENHQANKMVYSYNIKEDRLAVFSEMYYPYGWKINIDGEEVDMAQADYVLRAVMLPKGEHTISFTFDPDIIKVGSSITLATGILLGLLIIGGLLYRVSPQNKLTPSSKNMNEKTSS